jgi:octaprenyl-diphosphate synthase
MTAALQEIQAPIRGELEQVSEALRRSVTAHLPLVEEVNEHLMRMRGKMFRPTLLLLANEAAGTPSRRAITLGAVVELIHLATLVHDDSVDHSALRRGMPTVNSLFSHQVSVIMGDYLYSRALSELVRAEEIEAIRILTDASTNMSIGEMRQLAAFDALSFSEEDYEVLIHSKTATLMSAACELGALAGAPRHRAALARYGERLGMAFQVADDLLDYTEDAAVMGKPAGLDLREHKVTLPLIHALPRLSPAARARVESLFAAEVPEDRDITEVMGIVKEYGGLEYARQRGERFAQEAEEALGGLPESPARTALSEAIAYVMDRRW